MSSLKLSLSAALLSAVVTASAHYFLDQNRNHEADRLRAHNYRMRIEASRIAAKSAVATPQAAGVSVSSDVSASEETLAAPSSGPVENYRREGQATPLAALQTFAWACDRGDTGTVGKLLHIDDAARAKAQAYMDGLPENIRRQWATLDEMAVVVLTRSVMDQPFPNADILETATIEEVTSDRVQLRLPNAPRDRTVFQKTESGWKYALTEAMVDDYLNRMKTQERAAP